MTDKAILDKYGANNDQAIISKYTATDTGTGSDSEILSKYETAIQEDNTFDKMSKFEQTLDILGRPGYAIKSVIQEAMVDTPKTGMEAIAGGFTGKERVTANKLLKNVGIEGIPLLGFASEIALDPLSYFGGAGYKALAKGITLPFKAAAKGIKYIPGAVKIAEKAKPVVSTLRQMFVTKTGFKRLNDIIGKHLTKREYLQGKELVFGKKMRDAIQHISAKYKQPIDIIEQQVINLIEQPNVRFKGASFEAQKVASIMKLHLSNILTKELKAGVPITALSGGAKNMGYFPRITTKEAAQYLKKARIGNSKVWNSKIANALQRKTGDFTLLEFNDFVAAHGLKSLGGKSVEQFFLRKPAEAVYGRGFKSAKAVTSAEFFDEVGKVFGLNKAPSYWEELPEAITRMNPSLIGKKFDPEVAAEVGRVGMKYINPNEAKGALKAFDSLQNIWKKWTLAPFPKYHLRNMVGNMWNNHLAGVGLPNYGKAQALQMYRKYKGKGGMLERFAIKELDNFNISPVIADDLIASAEKTGVLGQGWYGADIETAIERTLKGQKGLVGRGMAFGSTVENNARLAHFLDRTSKGDDVTSAAISVKKFLFDYKDLTAFERDVMKRFMPFYTWTRKNIPLQLEQIYKQPQKFAPITHPLRQRDKQDLLKLKYAKPQLYERLPIELKRNADTVTYIPLEGLLPAGDLSKIVRPDELFVEMVTPYLKTPIELLINKSFYYEGEIQRYDNQTQELIRMDVPVKLKYALTTILPQARMLNELNKLVKKDTRKEKLTVDEQMFSQSLSSLYKVSLKDLEKRAVQRVSGKMKDLKNGMFWAKRYGREDERKRIKQTYEDTKKILKNLRME